MSLRDRLAQASVTEQPVEQSPPESKVSVDAKDAIKRNLHYLLIEDLGTELETADEGDPALRFKIERKLQDRRRCTRQRSRLRADRASAQ
jgi:hypothetical protein